MFSNSVLGSCLFVFCGFLLLKLECFLYCLFVKGNIIDSLLVLDLVVCSSSCCLRGGGGVNCC